MRKHSKQRFELEEFDDESQHKLHKSWSKRPTGDRCKPNWKRLWLDHPYDYESYDEFFCSR